MLKIHNLNVRFMRIVDKDKLNYRLENILSSGSFSTIIALSIVVILLIVFLSLLVWIFGSNPGQSFADQLWIYFNTGFGRSALDGSWIYRLTSFILVIAVSYTHLTLPTILRV